MILVPTVQHTGSHFVVRELFPHHQQTPLKKPVIQPDTLMMDHVLPTKMTRMLTLAKTASAIVIPLRHPRVCAYSWIKSGKELFPDFSRQWDCIWRFEDEGFDVHYITLDNEELRDEQLKALCKAIGDDIYTDWPELGQNAALRNESLPDMMLLEHADRVNDVCRLHKDRLERFYGAKAKQETEQEEKPKRRGRPPKKEAES